MRIRSPIYAVVGFSSQDLILLTDFSFFTLIIIWDTIITKIMFSMVNLSVPDYFTKTFRHFSFKNLPQPETTTILLKVMG